MTQADRTQNPSAVSENVACTASNRRATGISPRVQTAPKKTRPANISPEAAEELRRARDSYRASTIRRADYHARHFPTTDNRTYGGARD